MTELRHRSGCVPGERTANSCPCGALDAARQQADELAEDRAEREAYERGAA